ncbi:MAG: 4a-hydroxytetrahydrobiopterin dehydratase [Rubrimonas sp.]
MTERLTVAERAEHLTALAQTGWGAAPGGRDAIRKVFLFADFSEAWGFMARAALAAEKLNHHPEWFNVWRRVDVTLSTHDAGGLTMLDVRLARRMDALAGSAEIDGAAVAPMAGLTG